MKFVVIGAPRTGTTMFLVTLDTLKEFEVYGEVLGNHKKNPVKHPQLAIEKLREKTLQASSKISGMSMNQYLNWLFNTGENVGFKFLYQHVMRMKQAANYIVNKKNNVYRVHLKRKNPVKRAISGRLNKYHHYGTGNNSVNVEGILKSIKKSEAWDKELFKRFGKEKYIEMYYEDFTKDTNANEIDFTDVFNLFELDINPIVKVPTKKYGPDKLVDRIGNYESLYKYFKKNAPEYLKYIEED